MNILRLGFSRAVPFFLLAGAVACSAGSEAGELTKTGDQQVSMMVDAKAGATLLLEDGARVHLPPGALAADAEVSLSREACDGIYSSDRFQSCVYRVSAPDAVLNERFVVSLATSSEDDAPTDCAAALTEDGWRCLVDTELLDGSSEASASTFTDFTVRAGSDDIVDHRCTDVPFEPCGGALEGSWTLTGACGSMGQVTGVTFEFDSDPYEACDPFEHYMEFPFSVDASLEFRGDGTLRVSEQFSISGHTMVTEACLAQVGETCSEDCTSNEGVCDCVSLSSVGGHGSDEPWAYGEDGTFIYFEQPFGYCLQEDRLTVEFPGRQDVLDPHIRVYERAAMQVP